MPGADKKRRRRRRRRLDEDPFQALVDRALQTPQARSLLERAEQLIDNVGRAIDPGAYPPVERPKPRPQPRPKPRPRRPKKIKRANQIAVARTILHFTLDEPLTKDKVSKRRRDLAALCHPDRGADPAVMVKINQAADILINSPEVCDS